MPRVQSRRRRRLASSGYSLVEVMVAMLIASVMVTAVLGVAVTASQGGAKSAHKQTFDQSISQLSTELKEYVTACGCIKSTGDCSVPAGGCTTLPGPNGKNAGVATWYINGASGGVDASGNPVNIVDSAGAVWALKCGNHTLTGVVPALEAPPYNGSITYSVTWPTCNASVPGISEAPAISFTANWTEP